MARLRSHVKQVVQRTHLDQPLASALEHIGAGELARRLRTPYMPAVVVLRLRDHDRRRQGRIAMWSLDGRDQTARALNRGGWRGFEPPLPSAVAAFTGRWPGTLLDVGANTGLYSLIAAAHPSAGAIAFEPVPEIADLLRANLALNGCGARVAVEQVAVADAPGHTTLYLPRPQEDGTVETSASLEAGFKSDVHRVIDVPVTTLDRAWEDHGQPHVTMVKVDAEGSEARVLRGATALTAACRPLVSVEVLTAADAAALDAIRAELTYTDVALAPTVAVFGRPAVSADPAAPNHLLVPSERLEDVLAALREIDGLEVTAHR